MTELCTHAPHEGCSTCCLLCDFDRHICPSCEERVPHGRVYCEACWRYDKSLEWQPKLGGPFYFSHHSVERARGRLGLEGEHHQVLAQLIRVAEASRLVRKAGRRQLWRALVGDLTWNFVVIESDKPLYLGQLAVVTVLAGERILMRGIQGEI